MVGPAGKRITARFYQTEAGKQPARDWVWDWTDVETVEQRWADYRKWKQDHEKQARKKARR
jgi:hypothetical protein